MEFIIVDDESIDKTFKIIHEFVQIDSRFKYLSSKNGDSKLAFKNQV